MLGRLLSLVQVTRRDPGLTAIALRVYLLLIFARIVITIFPLRRITKHLGKPMAETSIEALGPEQSRYARRVGWCIGKLSPHTPTESNCYPQALAARWLLHRKGIPSTFYYGAAFEPGRDALQTHVWLRCGSLIVTGGRAGRQFQPLTYYADEATPARG
jgi:hypothetical protein